MQPIDDAINQAKEERFPELLFYRRYRDDCIVLWNGSYERLNEFHDFINTLDDFLKFTIEIGGYYINFMDLRMGIH